MKYLTNYIEDKQTELFNATGAFFAFNKEQYEAEAKKDVTYTTLPFGMICPVNQADYLIAELSNIHEQGIAADLAENGIENIVKRELSNHEAYYTYDISDTCDSLSSYGITREQVQAVFNVDRHNNLDL